MSRSRFPALIVSSVFAVCSCLSLASCGPKPASQNPINPQQMQQYDQMMKSGGMRPAGTAAGGAPMVAPPGSPAGMPGAPGTGLMPGAPGTGTMPGAPGTMPGAPMTR